MNYNKKKQEEISSFLTKWSKDIYQRLKVLLMLEVIHSQNKEQRLENRSVQTEETSIAISTSNISEIGNTINQIKSDGLTTVGRRTGFQRSIQRVQAAMRIQSVFRGHKDRVVVGNFKTKHITFFHARDQRIRDIWVSVAHKQHTQGTISLLDVVYSLLSTKVTANYVADSDGKERESFTNFLFDHYQTSLSTVADATKSIANLLLGLSRLLKTDILFSIITNLILNIWGLSHSNFLCRAMCCVQSILTKSGNSNLVNPAVVFDQNTSLSQQQVKVVVKSLLTETTVKRAATISDAVLAKCKLLESRRLGKTPNNSVKGTFITQNEFYYSLLISISPDILTECGYGSKTQKL